MDDIPVVGEPQRAKDSVLRNGDKVVFQVVIHKLAGWVVQNSIFRMTLETLKRGKRSVYVILSTIRRKIVEGVQRRPILKVLPALETEKAIVVSTYISHLIDVIQETHHRLWREGVGALQMLLNESGHIFRHTVLKLCGWSF